MEPIPFTKAHGLGNDFVVIDARTRPLRLGTLAARAIADRYTGVGCDQLIVIEPPRRPGSHAFMRILNADGGEVEACGNATRCVARLLMDEAGSAETVLETIAGTIAASAAAHGHVTVDLGAVGLDWRSIPLAEPADTLHLPVKVGPLVDPVAVSVGNPHAVFFVADAAAVALKRWGPEVEHHPLFPARTNVEVVHVLARDRLRLRVWERGVGITRACGTGACAAVVAAARRGLADRRVTVALDGGILDIVWRDDGHVEMTGAVATTFHGTLNPAVLAETDAHG
jgi:diaminopimelate epimerase